MATTELVQILIPLHCFSAMKGIEPHHHPGLDAITSRAECQSRHHSDFMMMFELFDLDNSAEIPAAQLRCSGESTCVPETNFLYCADPVTLIADRDQLIIHRVDDITQAESDELVAAFNQLFSDEQLLLMNPDPVRWYLQLPYARDLNTRPLFKVDGDYFASSMPHGKDQLWWRKILAEIEMLFYTHPVNQRRVEAGKAMINSLWLWGGGHLSQSTTISKPPSVIVGDDPYSKGIAKWLNADFQEINEINMQDMTLKQKNQRLVICFNGLNRAMMLSSQPSIHLAIDYLEREWLSPLISAVKQGQLSTLEIWIGKQCYRYNRQRSHYFWKRGIYQWNE